MKNIFIKSICAAAILSVLLSSAGCSAAVSSEIPVSSSEGGAESQAKESSETIADFDFKELSEQEISDMREGINSFSFRLFKAGFQKNEDHDNIILSPMSVYTALAMLDNGASGLTDEEIRRTLSSETAVDSQDGSGSANSFLERDTINRYIKSYIDNPGGKSANLSIADSFWLIEREDIILNENYPRIIGNYYDAEMFSEPVGKETAEKINGWVSEKTNGMIEQVLDPESVNEDSVSFLINAAAFVGKWKEPYYEDCIYDGKFNNYDGSVSNVEFMRSEDNERYFQDENSSCFVKYYDREVTEKEFCFIAILPNEDVGIDGYIDHCLKYDTFEKIFEGSTSVPLLTSMPKFSFDKYTGLKEILKDMGINAAFSREGADFSEMADSKSGSLRVGDVFQKARIEVDEAGTKAAAATVITTIEDSVSVEDMSYSIVLNRPFVFAVYDCENNIPVFVGAVMDFE